MRQSGRLQRPDIHSSQHTESLFKSHETLDAYSYMTDSSGSPDNETFAADLHIFR